MLVSTGPPGAITHRPGRRVRVIAAGTALAMSLGVVQAQDPAPAPVDAARFAPAAVAMRVAEWQAAGRTHLSGQFDAPAAAVAGWPPELTRVVVDRAIRRGGDKSSRAPDDSATDRDYRTALAKGLMLHTDIAIAERTGETRATTGTRAWTLLDAKPLAPTRHSTHWGLARLLAAALAKDPAAAPIARAWFRAVGALYQQWADLGQLRAYLAAAADLLPDDPVLLLYTGALHQGYADARVQSYVMGLRRPQGDGSNRFVQTLSIEDTDAELLIAERYLRRALAIEPSLVEARIRLAHVQDARGKSAEAVALAREALGSALPTFLEYYGAMILGRSEARLGHHGEARAAFERAVARYPHSQSARVALSHLDLVQGRPAEGVAGLLRALGSDAPETIEDPWSWYFRRHEPNAQSCLEDLKRSVQ